MDLTCWATFPNAGLHCSSCTVWICSWMYNVMALHYVRCLRDPFMPQGQVTSVQPSSSLTVNPWGLESAHVAFNPDEPCLLLPISTPLPSRQTLSYASPASLCTRLCPTVCYYALMCPRTQCHSLSAYTVWVILKKIFCLCGFNQLLRNHNYCLPSSSLLASDLIFSNDFSLYLSANTSMRQFVQNQDHFPSPAKVILVSTWFFSQWIITTYYCVHTRNVMKLLDPA